MNILRNQNAQIYSVKDSKDDNDEEKSSETTYSSRRKKSTLPHFIDRRSAELKKCFINEEDQTGSQMFTQFLDSKAKQVSVRSIDRVIDSEVDDYIIDGSHPLKVCWDLFVGILIMYSAVSVPYRLGFGLDSRGGWLIVDYTVDSVFFLDMVISFNTSINDGGKEVIKNRKDIARKYFKTWFIPDFISTFPFDTIVFLTVKSFSSNNLRTFKLVRVLRLFRLLKIFRIIRLNRKLQNAKAGGHINVFVYDLLLVMSSVFFMAHFFSCIFYQFLDCEPDDDNFTACGNKAAYSQYLVSLSWSLQTILNIGYGNIVLSSLGGRIFSIFAIVAGAVIFGFVIAVMIQAASNKTPAEQEEQTNMAMVGAYLNERNVSHRMKLTIWRHCRYYYAKKAVYDVPDTFQTAPVALRHRFFNSMKSNITKLQVFENNFTTFSRIQKHLHPLRVEPGDSVVHQGDYCTDLFFVQSGIIHAFIKLARTKYFRTFVGEFCEGYEFGVANAMGLKDESWATYRANEASDLLWIDLTRLDLDDDIVKEFEIRAVREMKLQGRVEALLSDLKVINSAAELYSTSSVIYNNDIVLLDDIDGKVTDHNELKSGGKGEEKEKVYRIFRPMKDDAKNHEIVFETTAEMWKRWVINPNSKYKSYFDGYIAICTILVIVLLPLRMGFSIEPNAAWYIYDVIIEISFIFDIIFSFLTAYEMSDLVLNTDRSHISARYMKGWFTIDVVSGFPVTLLTLNDGFLLLKLFKFARIMRLIRVMRVFKVARLLKILKLSSSGEEKPFSTSDETYVKFARLSFVVLMFTHITACFWGKLSDGRKGSNNWEAAIDVDDDSLWTRYLASFYFIYVTMNTTGYGDILAQNDMERFVLLFIIVLGSFLVAHVVGEISENNSSQDCSSERVFLLRSYLSNKQIPAAVQQAMLKQVTHANTVRTSFSEVEIWEKMPFQVRVELAMISHNEVITQFPVVFDDSRPPIVYQLLRYYEPIYILAGVFAFTFETGSGGIYLVTSGVAEVVDENGSGEVIILGEHKAGHVFGVECITNEDLTFLGVRAKEDTSCYRLGVSTIPALRKEHPSLSRVFFQNLKKRYKSTVTDASKSDVVVPPPIEIKSLSSFGSSAASGWKTIAGYFLSSLKYMTKEEEDLDPNVIYRRIDVERGRWSPYLWEKVNTYVTLGSPSLILSNESWVKFVKMKDSKVASDDISQREVCPNLITESNFMTSETTDSLGELPDMSKSKSVEMTEISEIVNLPRKSSKLVLVSPQVSFDTIN